jgi:hypothetical protein
VYIHTHTHNIPILTSVQVKSKNREGKNCISRNAAVLIMNCRHKRREKSSRKY